MASLPLSDMPDAALAALNAAIQLEPYNVELRQQRQEVKYPTRNVPLKPVPAPPAVLDQVQQQCRIPEAKIQTDLFCEYNRVTCDFLKLAPMALEGIMENPYILIYHNVIYDREIQHIRNALHHCPSGMRFGDELGVQGCHLPDDYSLETQLINDRIEHMTSHKRFSEGLAVIEYATTETLDILQLQLVDYALENLESYALSGFLSLQFENFHLDDVEGSLIMFVSSGFSCPLYT